MPLGIFHDGRDVGHPADVEAAVADKDPHPGRLLGEVLFRREIPCSLSRVPRASARARVAAAAAALPSITDWGMSLGPLKAPQEKMPSRKVVVGSKQEASTKLLGLSGTSSFSARSTTSGGHHHAHGQDHGVKDFVRDLAGFGDVAHLQVAVVRPRASTVCTRERISRAPWSLILTQYFSKSFRGVRMSM